MFPSAYIAAAIAKPNAIPIASQSPRPPRAPIPMLNAFGGTVPLVIMSVIAAAPAPIKTKKKVPINSARHLFVRFAIYLPPFRAA